MTAGRAVAAGAAIVSLAWTGCGSLVPPVPTQIPPDRRPLTPNNGLLGDSLTLEGYETDLKVTAVNVLDPAPSHPPDAPLHSGDRFVGIEISIANIGERAWSGAPAGSSDLATTAGPAPGSSLISGPCGREFSRTVTVAAGRSARGCVVFSVAKGARAVSYGFDPGVDFTDEDGLWRLRPLGHG